MILFAPGSVRRRRSVRTIGLVLCAAILNGCAARGHIATPVEVSTLRSARGLSSSGKLTLSSPRGRFSTRIIFGVAAPDSLRIEIPGGAGLRFLLLARDGKLRADLPEDGAMFEGPATTEVMNALFGIDLSPKDLVEALLGQPSSSVEVSWRFDKGQPVHVSMNRTDAARLSLSLDDPQTEAPPPTAFDFSKDRRSAWTLAQMSERLGLVR